MKKLSIVAAAGLNEALQPGGSGRRWRRAERDNPLCRHVLRHLRREEQGVVSVRAVKVKAGTGAAPVRVHLFHFDFEGASSKSKLEQVHLSKSKWNMAAEF